MIMSNTSIAWAILKFIAAKENANEEAPIVLGNVKFWLDRGSLYYMIPLSQWDVGLVQNDIDARAAEYKDELYAHLEKFC